MVQIPTSRDVQYVSARSGRASPSGPSVSVGDGLANLGQGMVQAAYNIDDLRTLENKDLANTRGNEVSTELTKFLDSEEQGYLKARDGTSENAIGFTRQYMEGYQQRADDFAKKNFAGLSPDDQTRYNNTLLSNGNVFYKKSAAYEGAAKEAFYDRGTNSSLDKIRSRVQANAAPFADLKKEGLAAIDSADMPEPWKAEKRAAWEADAAESKWKWNFAKDPKAAISQLKAPSGSNEGQAYQRLISKGWTPAQAAGIVGNIAAESGLNTQARNPGDGSDGSDSIGIAQWNGNRAKALKSFADANGTDWHDLNTQIDFIDHELRTTEKQAGENLARSTTVEDAAAAFVGYERPQGWSPSNAKGAMHWDKRRDHALRIAGADPAAEDADLDSIPFPRREQLANAGQSEYDQQRTKERADTKDTYRLMIETQPDSVDPQIILRDTSLDNGDKASLIGSLNTAMEKTGNVNQALSAFADGKLGSVVDPFSSDGKKTVDGLYDRMEKRFAGNVPTGVVDEMITQSGSVPQKIVNSMRGAVQSNDATTVQNGAQLASRISAINPNILQRREGGAELQKLADDFGYYVNTLNMSPTDAAKRIAEANDPLKKRDRQALEPVAKEFRKEVEKEDLATLFDESWLPFNTPEIGFDDAQKVGIMTDYLSIAENEFYRSGGNADIARNRAKEEMKRLYGVTEMTGKPVVMKYPPEKFWPADNTVQSPIPGLGSHPFQYVKTQLYGEIMSRDSEFQPDSIRYTATPATEAMIKRGEPPAYAITYKDANGVIQSFPGKLWRPDFDNVERAKKAEAKRVEDDAREQDTYVRETVLPGRDREQTLDNFLLGNPLTGQVPDSLKGGQ